MQRSPGRPAARRHSYDTIKKRYASKSDSNSSSVIETVTAAKTAEIQAARRAKCKAEEELDKVKTCLTVLEKKNTKTQEQLTKTRSECLDVTKCLTSSIIEHKSQNDLKMIEKENEIKVIKKDIRLVQKERDQLKKEVKKIEVENKKLYKKLDEMKKKEGNLTEILAKMKIDLKKSMQVGENKLADLRKIFVEEKRKHNERVDERVRQLVNNKLNILKEHKHTYTIRPLKCTREKTAIKRYKREWGRELLHHMEDRRKMSIEQMLATVQHVHEVLQQRAAAGTESYLFTGHMYLIACAFKLLLITVLQIMCVQYVLYIYV